ncbi:MAG: hypothetical protein RLY66_630 [Candidatus Parcubacteria bacterium]|jgi:tRNA-specific 2-thiouridylase
MKSQAIRGLNTGLKKKVFVGLSGGVDSSVSAALLKKAGYDVTGVFIRTWQPDWLPCTWREERRDAMRVAAHLDIPFATLDLEKEYKRDVADYMIAEYKAGRTPNPDVMCNKSVKFGGFYDWAMAQGADYVATGHYAQVSDKNSMLMGVDSNKDQSYFLWTIRHDQLPHILFPIGHLAKPEVRKLAAKFKLPTAEKKDSQGICFIGMVDMKDFLAHYIESKEGSVLNEAGKVIGTHSGAVFLTIGERHGFTITEKGSNDEAYYVIAKDIEKNTITVGPKLTVSNSSNTSISIMQTNWMNELPILGKKYQARGRYRQTLNEVVFTEIDTKKKTAVVTFTEDSQPMASGQSLVIYDGEMCAGGGVIQ